MVAAAGGGERPHGRRPDLADFRRRGPERAAAGGVDAGRRPPERRPRGRGCRARRWRSAFPSSRCFPTRTPSCAPTTAARPSIADNLVCRATRAIRKAGLDIGVLLDVALDPYTSHGHDGLMRGGEILNDETLARARAPGARAGGGRLRHHRALRHDGRPRRRHPHGAGGRRPQGRADHGLRGQVCLRLLWTRSATPSARRRR